MTRRKKGQKCKADNSHALPSLNEIEGSFQTFLNAKNQPKENSIEATLHPIIIVKNARVRARAEMSRYNAIPVVCGGGNCSCYPHYRPDFFNSRGGREMLEIRSQVIRG